MAATSTQPPPFLARSADAAGRNRWVTLAVLCASLLVIVVDNTIVNVALPTLTRELGTSISQLQWVVDAYTLVFAGLLLTMGALGDKFGRRGALTAGLVIFGGASFVASLSTTADQLVLWRAVMGIGAALIMPATLSILTNVFTDAKQRAIAIGIWSGVAGLAVALGPVIGGFLLEHFSWGSIFFVNVPIVIAALIAGRLFVPTSRDPEAPRLDVPGSLLSIAGLGALVWTLIEAPSAGWLSNQTLLGGLIAISLLAVFIRFESRTESPLLDLGVFRNARFSAASGAITLLSFALFGFIFMVTQYLQLVMGYSALAAGVHTLPFAAAAVVTAPTSAKLAERFGTKLLVSGGLLSFTVGLAIASTSGVDTGYTRVWIAMLFMGGGMGMAQAPATESIMGSLPKEKAGVGSAVNDTTRELGGALGVAVIGSIMASLYASRVDTATTGLAAPVREAAGESLGAAIGVSEQLGAGGAGLVQSAQEAFVHAMTIASLITAAFAVVGALVAWKWLPARAPEPVESPDSLGGVADADLYDLVTLGGDATLEVV